jgi:Tfp pilus assembly protein PilF
MPHVASPRPSFTGTLAASLLLLVTLAGCAGLAPTDEQRHETNQRNKYAQLVRMGDSIRQNGDPAAARVFYERAYALDPTRPEPLIGIAEAALQSGAVGGGAYRRALAIAPQRTDPQYGLGRALLELGQTDLAMDAFSTHPQESPVLRNNLAMSLALAGWHDAALATL